MKKLLLIITSFTLAAFPGNEKYRIPIGIGWDFSNGRKAWNGKYENIFSGEEEFLDVWYNFPIIIPFIPYFPK